MLIPRDRVDEEPTFLARIRRGERIEHYETVRRRKDGMLLDISLSVSPITDAHGRIVGASKIARDITERKLSERKLRESEERFRTMADSSPIMNWMTNAAGQTTFFSRAYLEYFGVPADSAATFDWSQIVHPEDRDAYIAAFQKALQTGETFNHQCACAVSTASGVGSNRAAIRYLTSRQHDRLIGSSPDITDIYESQQRLKELDQRKDEFLANMSHEIRSPLTGHHGFRRSSARKVERP